ncbi:MAG: hypothetical protein JW918_18065 [Anaerolineae bacterium]|nr:hypothetical protein [Anaerolineae bacterium]
MWIFVGVLALVLRLANLDAAPLAAHEAREAMLAWRAVTGQGMPDGGYSPFLFAANALLFALCGASDALARLWPVLFGSAFVLTPLLFRQRVGRVGALAAGLYLAISPMALFASRQLDGAVMVALGGAVFFGGSLRFVEAGSKTWLILAAVGLALAVTSGPSAAGMLLSLGLACLGFGWSWPVARVRWLWACVRPHFGHVSAAFLVAFIALATGLGWNLHGVGAAGDMLSAWLSRFGVASLLPIVTLAVYEPLALLASLIGLVWFVWRKGRFFQKRRFGLLLGLWIGVALLLLSIASPQVPARAVWVVLPLALLGGISVEAVAQNWRVFKRWRGEWIYACIILVLWVYLYLRFASYGWQSSRAPLDLVVGIIAFVLPLLLLVLAAIGFAVFSGDDREAVSEIVGGAKVVLWGTAVGVGGALLLATFSIGWGCAHVRPADPRELLVYDPTADEVHDLVQTLRDISWRETGLPMALGLAYEAPANSVLTWYLRDFDAARRVDDLRGLEPWELSVVVTLHRDWPSELPEGVSLAGRDFALSRSWSPRKLGCALEWPPCNESMEWLFYRAPKFTPRDDHWLVLDSEVEQWAVIWVHTNAEADVQPLQ